LFGVQAHVTFNIGNILAPLLQQVHSIATHDNLKTIFELFQNYQPYRPRAFESVIRYKAEAAAIGPKTKQFLMVAVSMCVCVCEDDTDRFFRMQGNSDFR
jgi:hypothetical protein